MNSRVKLNMRDDPVDPGFDEEPKNTSRSFGKMSLNVYKPGFIDTESTEDMKMAIDRELASISKALFQTEETTNQRIDEIVSEGLGGEIASIKEQLTVLTEEGKALAERVLTLTAKVNENSALIKETQQVVAGLEYAMATVSRELTAEVANRKAAILEEARVRADADGALGERITAIDVSYKGITDDLSASIRNEELARVTADEALAARTSSLEASITGDLNNLFKDGNFETDDHGLSGNGIRRDGSYTGGPPNCPTPNRLELSAKDNVGVSSVSCTPGDIFLTSVICATDKVNAPRLSVGLVTTLANGNPGPILIAESKYPSSAWSALEGRITIPEGVVSCKFYVQLEQAVPGQYWMITGAKWNNVTAQKDIFASIKREEEARVTEDEALALSIEKMDANFQDADNLLKASIEREQEVRAGETGALAKDIDTLTVNVNGQIAQVQQTAQAAIDATGKIEAKWGVTVDTNGKVAGIELNNGTGGSEFSIRADKFSFSDTSGTKSGGFTSSGGITTFNGDLIARTFQGAVYNETDLSPRPVSKTTEGVYARVADSYISQNQLRNVDPDTRITLAGYVPVLATGNGYYRTYSTFEGEADPGAMSTGVSGFKVVSGNGSTVLVPFSVRTTVREFLARPGGTVKIWCGICKQSDMGFGGGSFTSEAAENNPYKARISLYIPITG